jgi:hypothetical protein
VLPSVADSIFRNQLSTAVLKLQESGKLAKMKNRWWKEERGGGKCVVSCAHALDPVDKLDSKCIQYHVVTRLIYLFICLFVCLLVCESVRQLVSYSVSQSVSVRYHVKWFSPLNMVSDVTTVCHILRLRMEKVATNILNNQFWTVDKGLSPNLGVGQ